MCELISGLFEPPVLSIASPLVDDLEGLFPEERRLVESAVHKRQREFATGRVCARRLLGRLGAAEAPLLRAPDGAPVWPPGVVGSISHTRDLCVAVAAPAARVRSLGVDVEQDDPLKPAAWSVVCTPHELAGLSRLPEAEAARWAKVFFSVKEAVQKAWLPLLDRRLGFQELDVALDPEAGRFTLTLPEVGAPLEGRFRRAGHWVLSAITLEATP